MTGVKASVTSAAQRMFGESHSHQEVFDPAWGGLHHHRKGNGGAGGEGLVRLSKIVRPHHWAIKRAATGA